MAKITVLGVFNADLKFKVARFPTTGETLHALSFDVQPGGKGFNQAIAGMRAFDNTKQQNRVAFLSQLGEDNFGEMARDVMQREGIDASGVLSTSEMPTGTAMIMVEEKSADNMIVIATGAASLVGEKEVAGFGKIISGSEMMMTNFELPPAAVMAGLKLARSSNVPTLLDPAPAIDMPDNIFHLVDYITPNESEAAALVGFEVANLEDAKRAGNILCERGVKTAIITMGGQGVVAVNGDIAIELPALKPGKVVDTTGAGDAFNGCFAARICEGATLEDALRFASAGAALCVGRYGTADAMAQRAEIDEFLSRHTLEQKQ